MFLELCKKRRSIRKFKEKEVSDKDINYILNCALTSPTAKGIDSKKYIVVRDKEMLEKLSEFKESAAKFLKNSNVAIVVLTDKEKASETFSQDASITATFIQLAATSLGLGSCWANVLERKNKDGEFGYNVISNILEIPKNYNIECIIGIGYADHEPIEKKELDFEEHVHYEKF